MRIDIFQDLDACLKQNSATSIDSLPLIESALQKTGVTRPSMKFGGAKKRVAVIKRISTRRAMRDKSLKLINFSLPTAGMHGVRVKKTDKRRQY